MQPAAERFWTTLEQHNGIALSEGTRTLSYAELRHEVAARASQLQQLGVQRVALALDNGLDWALWDLALLRAGLVCVPLPGFFSPAQQAHVLNHAGIDCLIGTANPLSERCGFQLGDAGLHLRQPDAVTPVPDGTLKITYTSGTTGQPKGVCLDAQAQLAVADSLWLASQPCDVRQHLCVLPLATLLENIAGLYAPLLAGARIELRPLAEIGFSGAAGFDLPRFLATLNDNRPHSLILLPQLLLALVSAAEQGVPRPTSLRFIAVGGGRVAPQLLERAERLGLPVFEGYGLSECASVVCLNTPEARRIGTVGQPLAHVELRLADDGEVLIKGPHMLGYLGEPPLAGEWLATGDLGHFEDGFLILRGRKKHQFVTAYGRNVNPEWVEAELVQQAPIAQAWLHGEALAQNVAVLVPRRAELSDAELQMAVERVNAGLPDYARAHLWLRAAEAFRPDNGLATANGRLRRDALLSHYQPAIHALLSHDFEVHRMAFFDQLQHQTSDEREYLLASPIIHAALAGTATRAQYIAFLTQAYHHVKHTVPLLMACGARLPERLEWLREAIAEYIEEEIGHQEWILNDIHACGGDAEAARHGQPALPTELMVAYVYDRIARHNPVSFFGMVNVLEGTSIALATQAAGVLQARLDLPATAFSYLTSHGSLDLEHIEFFKRLMNRLDNEDDKAAVVHTARVVYRLYGDIFRSLTTPEHDHATA